MRSILLATTVVVLFVVGAMAAGLPHPITRTNGFGQVYTVHFQPGGKVFVNSTGRGGSGGRNFMTDGGQWWMQGGHVCWKYSSWQPGSSYCQ